MHFLYISSKPPYPVTDGGTYAMASTLRSLNEIADHITLVYFNTSKHRASVTDFPAWTKEKTDLIPVEIDNRITIGGIIKHLIKDKSYHVERFKSRQLEELLKSLLKKKRLDAVHIEGLPATIATGIVKKISNIPVIYRAHNIEYGIWLSLSKHTNNPARKWYLHKLSKQLLHYEKALMFQVDSVLALTENDARVFRQWHKDLPVAVIPFGVDIPVRNCKQTLKGKPDVFHLGAMDWIPNQEAIEWFLSHVWKEFERNFPDVHLYLAGRKMPGRFFRYRSNTIHVAGEVDDAGTFYQQHDILVVPVQSASGLRVKILEGMANGKAIISTPEGASGIDYTEGEHLIIARSAKEFVSHLSHLINHPEEILRLGENAKTLITRRYHHDIVTRQLASHYSKLIPYAIS